jgi:hypothetical protein
MGICALTQAVLYVYAVISPNTVVYTVVAHLVLAIGCIVYVVGEIVVMKMELEKKERVERVRNGLYVFGSIWFVLTMVILSLLGVAYKNL